MEEGRLSKLAKKEADRIEQSMKKDKKRKENEQRKQDKLRDWQEKQSQKIRELQREFNETERNLPSHQYVNFGTKNDHGWSWVLFGTRDASDSRAAAGVHAHRCDPPRRPHLAAHVRVSSSTFLDRIRIYRKEYLNEKENNANNEAYVRAREALVRAQTRALKGPRPPWYSFRVYTTVIAIMNNLATNFLSRIQGMMGSAHAARIHLHSEMYINGFAAIPLCANDRRTLDKTYKLMDGVMRACQSPRLNLKNSPPFILDILPDTFTQLIAIFTREPDLMRENDYLVLFVGNVQLKCKEVLKLFKTSNIFLDDSGERRKLTKLSLVFSHMLSELRAFFQNGEFVADKFRLTKKEADNFWKNTFKSKICVPWAEFVSELAKVQPVGDMHKNLLKATIDLTCNDYISMYEFDVFTRLFYPWKSLLSNWKLLTNDHPGYVAFLTYDEVKKRLDRYANKPGSYVFRLSCTRLGQWAIGYVAPDGKIYQTIPTNKSLIQAIHDGAKEGFYLFPDGRDQDIDLSKEFETPTADRVVVTSEQHKIYCEIGTTFELCKICDDNEKNVKLEPCGHLICSSCLSSWNDSEGGNTCPFCRDEIKGTARIVIDKFRSNDGDSEGDRKIIPKRPAPTPLRESSSALISFDDVSSPTDSIPPSLPPPPIPPRITRETNQSVPTPRSPSTPVALPSRISYLSSSTSSVPNIDAPAAPSATVPIDDEPPHSYVNVVDSASSTPVTIPFPSYVNSDSIYLNPS